MAGHHSQEQTALYKEAAAKVKEELRAFRESAKNTPATVSPAKDQSKDKSKDKGKGKGNGDRPPPASRRVCNDWVNNCCKKSAKQCTLLHEKLPDPCRTWQQKGSCKFGDKCVFQHVKGEKVDVFLEGQPTSLPEKYREYLQCVQELRAVPVLPRSGETSFQGYVADIWLEECSYLAKNAFPASGETLGMVLEGNPFKVLASPASEESNSSETGEVSPRVVGPASGSVPIDVIIHDESFCDGPIQAEALDQLDLQEVGSSGSGGVVPPGGAFVRIPISESSDGSQPSVQFEIEEDASEVWGSSASDRTNPFYVSPTDEAVILYATSGGLRNPQVSSPENSDAPSSWNEQDELNIDALAEELGPSFSRRFKTCTPKGQKPAAYCTHPHGDNCSDSESNSDGHDHGPRDDPEGRYFECCKHNCPLCKVAEDLRAIEEGASTGIHFYHSKDPGFGNA
jgi:hypothetical protein